MAKVSLGSVFQAYFLAENQVTKELEKLARGEKSEYGNAYAARNSLRLFLMNLQTEVELPSEVLSLVVPLLDNVHLFSH